MPPVGEADEERKEGHDEERNDHLQCVSLEVGRVEDARDEGHAIPLEAQPAEGAEPCLKLIRPRDVHETLHRHHHLKTDPHLFTTPSALITYVIISALENWYNRQVILTP